MHDADRMVRLGELLTGANVISTDKLTDGLELSKTIGQPIGQILIQSGDISKYQLVCAIQIQSLILEGALLRSDGVRALELICHDAIDFEEALVQVGFVGRSTGGTRLGELLFASQLLSAERLRQALAVSFETAVPLGQILVRQKFLRPQIVATALTVQNRIRRGDLTREQAIAELKALAKDLNAESEEMPSNTAVVETPARMNAFLLKRLKHLKLGTPCEVAQPPEEMIGSIIAEKYEISGFIGGGGMSLVYLVRHTQLDKVMAMKMMQPKDYGDEDMLKRFKREAKAISSVQHPNVVGIHDYGCTAQGNTYLIMDYVHGISLGRLIKQTGKLSIEETIPLFLQATNALQHIHTKRIIHRDVKPSNVMLEVEPDSPPMVKIVDFGIAKLLDEIGEDTSTITKSGELLGSPSYMSPEHCLGRQLDARSDIYSLGCVLYECLTGAPPFRGATAYEIFQRQMNERPSGLSRYVTNKRVCKEIENVVFRCLEKEQHRRFQTMDELATALMGVLNGSTRTKIFGF